LRRDVPASLGEGQFNVIARDAVVTFESIDGYRVAHSYGYVSGVASQPRNRFRETFRSLGALVGLPASEWVTDAEALRTVALDALCARADAVGANAVVKLQFHADEMDDGSCKVIAFGEAVILEKGGDLAR
jgi:uncharacterized protein YbjQ (UPF0145 family)